MGALVYILYLLTTATVLWLCVKSFERRETLVGIYLFWWMFNALVWSVTILLSANPLTPIPVIEFLTPIRMAVVVLFPLIMLFLALAYTENMSRVTRWRLAWLLVIPVCSLALLLGPWQDVFVIAQPTLLPNGLYDTRFGHGPWFMVHSIYCTLVVLAAGGVLAAHWYHSTGFYRRQAALLLTGYTLPVGGMLFTAFGPASAPRVDWSLLVFPITAACWYVAVYQYKLFDATPVTRKRAVELMSDAVIVLNAAHRVIDLNQSALGLVGADQPAHVIGAPLVELFSDHLDELEPVFTGSGDGVTLDTRSASGRRVWDVSYTALAAESGKDDGGGGMLVFRDATEKALLIDELDAYARTVAHDLKNPLSGLRGYLEIMEEDLLDGAEVEDTLEVVRRAQGVTEKMVEIVHELLLMAHIRSGADIPLGEVDMGLILGQVELRMSAQLDGVTLAAPRQWPRVLGYAPWLEEVWANYVSNALKYGGAPPTITIGAEVQGEGEARFWIQDNGEGMTEEQAATVFDEFTRLDQHKALQGHGVGLAVVRRVVERLGGRVGVEVAPDQGARFWFTLPSAEAGR